MHSLEVGSVSESNPHVEKTAFKDINGKIQWFENTTDVFCI